LCADAALTTAWQFGSDFRAFGSAGFEAAGATKENKLRAVVDDAFWEAFSASPKTGAPFDLAAGASWGWIMPTGSSAFAALAVKQMEITMRLSIAFKEKRLQICQEMQGGIGKSSALPLYSKNPRYKKIARSNDAFETATEAPQDRNSTPRAGPWENGTELAWPRYQPTGGL